MRISELKRSAKRSLKGNWSIAIGAFIIFGIITNSLTIPISFLTNFYSITINTLEGSLILLFLSIINFVILLIITGLLGAGFYWLYLDIYDGIKPKLSVIFSGFKKFWKIVGVTLLVTLFTLLWSLLFIVPGIIKSISYSQVLFLIRENPDMGVFEAIKESRNLMTGNKKKYLLTTLSFVGWFMVPIILYIVAGILFLNSFGDINNLIMANTSDVVENPINMFIGAILFLVGGLYMLGISFYLTPYYYTTMAGFYRELVGEKRRACITLEAHSYF